MTARDAAPTGPNETVSLEAIREKYPTANYAPDPACKKCGGKGEWHDARKFEFVKSPAMMRACICIFVEHSFAPEAARMLSEFATKELRKMRGGDRD